MDKIPMKFQFCVHSGRDQPLSAWKITHGYDYDTSMVTRQLQDVLPPVVGNSACLVTGRPERRKVWVSPWAEWREKQQLGDFVWWKLFVFFDNVGSRVANKNSSWGYPEWMFTKKHWEESKRWCFAKSGPCSLGDPNGPQLLTVKC
jgi:hypothetical protein